MNLRPTEKRSIIKRMSKIKISLIVVVAITFVAIFAFHSVINEKVGLWLLHYSDQSHSLVLGEALSVSDKNIILNEEEQDQYSSELVNVKILNGSNAGKEDTITDYAVIGENPDAGIQYYFPHIVTQTHHIRSSISTGYPHCSLLFCFSSSP
jgi:hypothetical protein